jgi:hypothetical protein
MNNKKGLSAVVATVLIILLVITAITLVWGPIRNMINEQSEEVEAGCLLANAKITKACMDTGDLKITISNGAESTIDDIQVIYGDTEENLVNSENAGTTIGVNSIATVTITSATGTPAFTRIAPVINGRTCEAGLTKAVTASC